MRGLACETVCAGACLQNGLCQALLAQWLVPGLACKEIRAREQGFILRAGALPPKPARRPIRAESVTGQNGPERTQTTSHLFSMVARGAPTSLQNQAMGQPVLIYVACADIRPYTSAATSGGVTKGAGWMHCERLPSGRALKVVRSA